MKNLMASLVILSALVSCSDKKPTSKDNVIVDNTPLVNELASKGMTLVEIQEDGVILVETNKKPVGSAGEEEGVTYRGLIHRKCIDAPINTSCVIFTIESENSPEIEERERTVLNDCSRELLEDENGGSMVQSENACANDIVED